MTTRRRPNRRSDDVGNIVQLEHVNVTVPDLHVATQFYTGVLGLTRDPLVELPPDLVWINAGAHQFHLPLGQPQVLRGRVDLVVPDLDAIEQRALRHAKRYAGTAFGYRRRAAFADVRDPWGNRIRCHQARADDPMKLGIRAVEMTVPKATVAAIARFYETVMGAPASLSSAHGRAVCSVGAGPGQQLRFAEAARIPDYDGHHLAVYVADFSGPWERLRSRGLLTADHLRHEYRFSHIVDPDDGRLLFEIEHEVRSLHHRLYRRPLVNRDPGQTPAAYTPGRDAFQPDPLPPVD